MPDGTSYPPGETPSPCPCCGTDAAAERAEERLVLKRLRNMGMEIAEAVHREALSAAAPGSGRSAGDFALVFARLSRAIRQTIALETKLAEDFRRRAAEEADEELRRRGREAREKSSAIDEMKLRVSRRMVREIDRRVDQRMDDDVFHDLGIDLGDRLEDPDIREMLAACPLEEIVARICRDLRLPAAPAVEFIAAFAGKDDEADEQDDEKDADDDSPPGDEAEEDEDDPDGDPDPGGTGPP